MPLFPFNNFYEERRSLSTNFICVESKAYALISTEAVENINSKYGLQIPAETATGIIDNGTINVQRDSRGDIVDIWYIYYTITDTSFSVKAALIDADNPLDNITGTITQYYLNGYAWTKKASKPVNKTAVRNGIVYTWAVSKWGVKEKFEYDLTVVDNGLKHKFSNIGKDDYTRYNFEAAPYSSFTANGGQRHHFIPATSLTKNNFDSSTAYCIRMMTADHVLTGSYGSSAYVSSITTLLNNKKYEDALKKEVRDLQSKTDSEGKAGNLQQKYYDEVVMCLYQYEILFGISN